MTVTIDEMTGAIMKVLNDFSNATNETVDNAANTAAKHAKATLRDTSPRLTGEYAKGWEIKTESKAKTSGRAKVIVHNRTNYQLTHLLENGHAKVVWGHRTGGKVEGKTHIKPVEETAKDEFIQLIRSGV